MRTRPRAIITGAVSVVVGFLMFPKNNPVAADEIRWQHLTSANGDLPVPGPSTQQTGAVVADFDQDGRNDFILSFRAKAPALVWYRRTDTGWTRQVIDSEFLTIEAGGATYDIDGDGDLDVVFGEDWQGGRLFWWENPKPDFDPNRSWTRHTVKPGGAHQHHDQIFADVLGSGRPQLAFWNQDAKTLFLATIPEQPKTTESWPLTPVFAGSVGKNIPYAEGLAAADIDGDGRVDLLAGNQWFQRLADGSFRPHQIAEIGGRIAAGQFLPGKTLAIVIAPGDGVGPLRWYQCDGDPTGSGTWHGHDLVNRPVIHGHSLQVADINGDGHLDIFCAEMAQWTEKAEKPDNPDSTAWIFYGDGEGHFRTDVLATGIGFHEAQVADLDGDGDLDILDKPYTWHAPRVDVWLNNGTGKPAASTP